MHVLSLKQGHSIGLLVVHLWFYDGLSRRPCGDCTHYDKREENEIRLVDSPATRYIGKAGNDDTEDRTMAKSSRLVTQYWRCC
jgi:hypothetical protein